MGNFLKSIFWGCFGPFVFLAGLAIVIFFVSITNDHVSPLGYFLAVIIYSIIVYKATHDGK